VAGCGIRASVGVTRRISSPAKGVRVCSSTYGFPTRPVDFVRMRSLASARASGVLMLLLLLMVKQR
jgi:hypothetical protein